MAERELTYREAINEALRQEMRRDDTIILMGEDVAGGSGQPKEMQDAWGGVLGVTKGLYTEFGAERVLDHTDFRVRLHRCGHRRSGYGPAPGGGVDVRRFYGRLS